MKKWVAKQPDRIYQIVIENTDIAAYLSKSSKSWKFKSNQVDGMAVTNEKDPLYL